VDAGVEVKHALIQPEMTGWRLDRALAAALPLLSRERLKILISAGAVRIGDRVVRDPASKVMGACDVAVAVPLPTAAASAAQDIPLMIAYEDEHLIVVDKPAGLVVHPACGNLDGTLVNALLHHCRGSLSGIGGVERPGIVHRIDKDTSGLMVAAKSDRAHAGLAAQFADHSIDRRYRAIVVGRPRPIEGRIEGNVGRSSGNRKKMAVVGAGQGKHAVTHYRTLTGLDDAALVECRLETGRTHQVRVHMASIGHPLLGDPVYGRSNQRGAVKDLGFRRQALHAARLGFRHPITRQSLSFDSNMPADMQELFSHLSV
jgi:23S rRNA pseudouridine1911/1915/1917 synthase